jgi:hypothetical protein
VNQVRPEVLRVSFHLVYQGFVLFCAEELEVVFSATDFKTSLIKQHNKPLFSILRREVHLIGSRCLHLLMTLLRFFKLNDLAEIEVIAITARFHWLLGPF